MPRVILSLALVLVWGGGVAAQAPGGDLVQALTLGALELAGGRTEAAIASFGAALALEPESPVAALDLAIAHLAAGHLEDAERLATRAAQAGELATRGGYVLGCIQVRRGDWLQATALLERVRAQKPFVAAVHFLAGWAAEQLGRTEDAAERYREAVRLDRRHGAASYRLSMVLSDLHLGQEAAAALDAHRRLLRERPTVVGWRLPSLTSYEDCELLEPVVPFVQAPPRPQGADVTFRAAAEDPFPRAAELGAPLCMLDAGRDGDLDLVAATRDGQLVLCSRDGDTISVEPLPGSAAGLPTQLLVGDLDNDGIEDLVAIDESGCRAWRMDDHGGPGDVTSRAGLDSAGARAGILVDLDHSGTLDLLVANADGLHLLANGGGGVLAPGESWTLQAESAPALALADLTGDDLVEVLVGRGGQALVSLAARRERKVEVTTATTPWSSCELLACGDVDGDLRDDVVALDGAELAVWTRGRDLRPLAGDVEGARQLTLLDFDDDGWLDVLVAGTGLRLWRNLGGAAFAEVTAATGLDEPGSGDVRQVLPTDWDADGDLDLLVAGAAGGLLLLVNQGGNAGGSVTVRLRGTRSNGSGIGARLEVYAPGLRASRLVSGLPVHIGLGGRTTGLVLNVIWLDQTFQLADIAPTPGAVLEIVEPYVETGSCPYLFAWDGERFRFVTDLLGGAPLGLPSPAPGALIPADPDELVEIGGDDRFQPRDGAYELRVTEELREVLYLDQVELVVADHPAGVEVHPTDKLRPPPFPASELVPLHRRREPLRARDEDQVDVTAELAAIDGVRVGPTRLLGPHLRGMAEPWSVTLELAGLDLRGDLVLALTGWLRYGGGTGNVAAGTHPACATPPGPTLHAEDAGGVERALPVVVGLPAGKTKTILVELAGLLDAGTSRLRLECGFEVYWDRIALFERHPGEELILTTLAPSSAVLRWHGHGQVEPAPADAPVTSSYERLRTVPPWRWTPGGSFTRYGPVEELLLAADDRLALLAGGDEIALRFTAADLPPCPAGSRRTFFLRSVGWDKDADPHCVAGLTVEPLPFHGMDDQRYGSQPRPDGLPVEWIERYNTRPVGPVVPGSRPDELRIDRTAR